MNFKFKIIEISDLIKKKNNIKSRLLIGKTLHKFFIMILTFDIWIYMSFFLQNKINNVFFALNIGSIGLIYFIYKLVKKNINNEIKEDNIKNLLLNTKKKFFKDEFFIKDLVWHCENKNITVDDYEIILAYLSDINSDDNDEKYYNVFNIFNKIIKSNLTIEEKNSKYKKLFISEK